MAVFRLIPSIEEFLQRSSLKREAETHGRHSVAAAARGAAAALRDAMASGGVTPASGEDASSWMERRVQTTLSNRLTPSLRWVINATGVILHTNLGRAPLASVARERAAALGGYSNLEYELETGGRGERHVHAERLLCLLTGAEAAAVANNNAAATLLVLAALAAGREVIVSRGELVEIGGGFRVPEVMAQSGAVLREVGTTNRTRISDYSAAIGERTALILRVHPSNFRIEGFTERPPLAELAGLAHRFQLPLFEDLGSGWLGGAEFDVAALCDEPPVTESLAAGVDLVAFSGDKLLGGPQSGLIVGRGNLVGRVRRHPLMRALRVDKLTYAALEATLALWAREPSRLEIPVYRMLTLSVDAIDARARALATQLARLPRVGAVIVDGFSTIGGGSAPGSALPTRLIALEAGDRSASALEARLRAADPPVIARIQDDRVVVDLRTVAQEEEQEILEAVRTI